MSEVREGGKEGGSEGVSLAFAIKGFRAKYLIF